MKMSDRFCRMFVVLLIGVVASSALAAEKPTSPQKTCVTEECHADYSKRTFVHTPVGLGDCKSCHKAVKPEEHTWRVLEGKDLCENCHLEQAAKKNVHDPLKTGDCVQCHDPHSSEVKALLKKKSVAELCRSCHPLVEQAEFLHGPTAVGECSVCHSTHSSDYESLLTMEPLQLCISCHIVTKSELEKFEFIHEPAKGDCAGCHDPHGADNWQMLRTSAPDMCYPCHEDIKKIADTSKHKHNVVSTEDGCLMCHTPHASTVKFILKSDPTTLCMTCHDKAVGIGTDEVLGAFTAEIENKKYLHGPVKEKDCSGCHVSHGSEHFRLLAKEYPPVFYAPFAEENYDLCFGCHPKTLVRTARTDDLTNFRNGNLNLHFLHVNKERRGRTCRACHHTHASNLPKHIRESVPYGAWTLPVGFSKTETGGTCSPGCHLPKDYDRETAVNYSARPTAKP
ncbi:MAG: cytochrome c3 family protein [Phycisphaerales bacterium]|nr:MAG: cytochrome c3 family protein [Phycisphaerales bacterium]